MQMPLANTTRDNSANLNLTRFSCMSVLAYQFGHELGHVTANSWQPRGKPQLPSQWLEEAPVERLVSDRQPTRIRIDSAIWLHPDGSSMAWSLDIGERAWMQLVCQFGHELGHEAPALISRTSRIGS